MPSQTDLDQGGTVRQWNKAYLGPSVGWVNAPAQNILAITVAGTYNVDPSVSLITVSVAGAVTLNLPSALDPAVGPQALPGLFVNNPITIADTGGNAGAFPIMIKPQVGQTMSGLPQIQITQSWGIVVVLPSTTIPGWTDIVTATGGGNLGGIVWTLVNTAATGNPGANIAADTSAGPFTITFILSPPVMSAITIADATGKWGINNLTINPNGQNINSVGGNLALNVGNQSVMFLFINPTIGWKTYILANQ